MENKTLVEQTAERMMEYIQEHALQAGDRLPTEPVLTQMLGVSRNTMREALKMLVSRNVLDIRQGAGTFISDKLGVSDDPLGFHLIQNQVKLTQDLMEIRYMLEPPLAALAAQHATPEELVRLQELCQAVEDAIANGEDFTQADQQFHAQIANCSHNLVMSTLIPVITEGVSNFSTTVAHEYAQTVLSHRQICKAIVEGRGLDAQQAMYFHILYNKARHESILNN